MVLDILFPLKILLFGENIERLLKNQSFVQDEHILMINRHLLRMARLTLDIQGIAVYCSNISFYFSPIK